MYWSRAQRERAKLAYLSGRGSLASVSEQTGIPHDTLRRWCSRERWRDDAQAVAEAADTRLTQELADFLAAEREGHIKRVLRFAEELQAAIDRLYERERALTPRDICRIAIAEDRINRMVLAVLGGGTSANE